MCKNVFNYFASRLFLKPVYIYFIQDKNEINSRSVTSPLSAQNSKLTCLALF